MLVRVAPRLRCQTRVVVLHRCQRHVQVRELPHAICFVFHRHWQLRRLLAQQLRYPTALLAGLEHEMASRSFVTLGWRTLGRRLGRMSGFSAARRVDRVCQSRQGDRAKIRIKCEEVTGPIVPLSCVLYVATH